MLFFVDETRNLIKTYADLTEDINRCREGRVLISESTAYDVFVQLLLSLINGQKVSLIDIDFSEEEIFEMNIKKAEWGKTYPNVVTLTGEEELRCFLENPPADWRLSLYTSGTTGLPKKIDHKAESIFRTLRKKEIFREQVWGLCYNPTHYAGIQVFFQALLNHNTIVFLFDKSCRDVENLIDKYSVTNISATPTFYRMTVPYLKKSFPLVRQLTSGGEKFDENLRRMVKDVFPRAKLKNIYASTETGTLFSSDGEYFYVEERMKDKIKIGEKGELLVHRDLVAGTDQDSEERWFSTGDIVEFQFPDRLKFLSRKSELINVGGYNVNPHEVEKCIIETPGVIDALVRAKKNRLIGNILIAEVIVEDDKDPFQMETFIYDGLKKKLQRWKLPAMIRITEKLDVSRNRKKERK